MQDYQTFLQQKSHLVGSFGFKSIWLPDSMFDHQKYTADWTIRKGRGANFVDTGLGKTIIQLVVAHNIVRKTSKRVLILTPLAVAFQFVSEAQKFGIEGVEYSKDGRYKGEIIIANYERLHYFASQDFEAVILDESSILKNFEGATKNLITSFVKQVKYRILSTATPAPNDYTELGTSSEALGYLGYMDMLTRFFKNNEDTISPANIGTEWILKNHARENFWKWVSSWSLSVRKPSDLGFSDENFQLPELIINDHVVKNKQPLAVGGQMQLFAMEAKNFQQLRAESRATLEHRCEKAVELARSHDTSVYWTNLNDEADLIESLDSSARQIKGTMSIDQKEELLVSFSRGELKKLITKPSITAFGLNWQHCAHTTYFPTHSYEQWYQAVRRFWRFGQTRDVVADRICSDGQTRVLLSLSAKATKAAEMTAQLNRFLHQDYTISATPFSKPVQLPSFLCA
ncbi:MULTISPECIES: DEAD/DEAH box helicase [unclassified Spirosoma]|uniref:DEAD/DEAH box helicase n=1 Tax=unclassified Spirosoma TaxID=2621999 RepID=UPI000969BEE7|nr:MULTISPECIES: DEAD/DEAH box helicase [unclassified Spirosoma]MBN8821302.1 hypothetical protein [Spirosoma sp.]OJW78091.1 MAG: hypothetical protein BGO59_29165 [Spirosoma sp. 48-14]